MRSTEEIAIRHACGHTVGYCMEEIDLPEDALPELPCHLCRLGRRTREAMPVNPFETAILYRNVLITIASRPCRGGSSPVNGDQDCREAGLERPAWCSQCLARAVLERREQNAAALIQARAKEIYWRSAAIKEGVLPDSWEAGDAEIREAACREATRQLTDQGLLEP